MKTIGTKYDLEIISDPIQYLMTKIADILNVQLRNLSDFRILILDVLFYRLDQNL